ncbi:cysteine-rich tail protein 1 [Mantella aurantiaca]
MDKGISVQNPYAGVNIPRAQLKSSFVRNTIGEDLDGVVITNPSAVPNYPSYSTPDRVGNQPPNAASWEGNKVHTQESWRRPYNPYASDKSQNGGHPNSMYTIDLDKRYTREPAKVEETPCCCYPCCRCCPCCQKSCCVIS